MIWIDLGSSMKRVLMKYFPHRLHFPVYTDKREKAPMKTLLPIGIALLLLISVFYQCSSTVQTAALPVSILASYADTLHKDAQPIKMLVNQKNERVYWLSFVGELHFIGQDGSEHKHLNQDHEAWKDVTFIEDFCIDESRDQLYFTDLMDLQTGQSAIKATDTEGKNVEVIAYLAHEIPYQLTLSADQEMLFYLSKTNREGEPYYRLRFLDLKEGIQGTMYSSLSRIDSLAYDELREKINIHNARQETFAFSADLQTMRGVAEAFKP